MTYLEAVVWLNRLMDFERIADYRYDAKHFNLERTARLLAAVGNPHNALTCAVVAGTNGKGSTAAMLTSILAAHGLSVGLYSSPHLVEYRERMRLNLEPVGPGEFARLADRLVEPVERLQGAGPAMQPTTFEVLTTMALLGFAERRVKVAVLEVGLGGRLDSVNIVNPAAVCVTPISLDHMDQLGGTVEAIAREKAGVIKSAAPVISGPQPPAALGVIQAACREVRAPLTVVQRELCAEAVSSDGQGSRFDAVTPAGRYERLHVSLLGAHQVSNALAAIGVAQVLGGEVSLDGVRRGLHDVVWPGRLQLCQLRPRVVLDGAHNAESASALAEAIASLFKPRRLALVFGQLRGKEHQAIARILCPHAEEVLIPELKHPRALPATDLATAARMWSGRVVVYRNAEAAFAEARARFDGQDDLILVTGSLALVGEVMHDACIS